MQIHFGLGSFQPEWPGSIVCLGSFDGVHLGHQAVIGQAVQIGQQLSLPSVVVTFDRHPLAILAPDRCPPALATLEQNLDQFRKLGVSAAMILPFDAALREMSAHDFLFGLLIEKLRAKHVVVGHDFSMGKDRAGSAEWIAASTDATIVPPFLVNGTRVSSRLLRTWVQEGDFSPVRAHLGRDFALSGIVVAGQQLGRTIGFPTANLARSRNQVVPSDGVYAGRAVVNDREWLAAIGIGHRPTVGGGDRSIEAYLLDYDGPEFYGSAIELQFAARIREELHLDSLEALQLQMNKDVEWTRDFFRTETLPQPRP